MDLGKITYSNYAKYLGMHLFLYGLKDIFIVYHSPAGCKKKSEFTLSPNDLNFNENHYYDNYINNVESVFGTEESLLKSIRYILKNHKLYIIYIITTDVPEIIGFDINKVLYILKQEFTKTTFIHLSGQAIGGNMYNGYIEALFTTLNNSIEKEKIINKRDNKALNIIGYFFHRYEGDFYGDYNEIKMILSELGISINTFLPGVTKFKELNKLSNTNNYIIFFPFYNEEILNLLGSFNIKIVKLPIGIRFTTDFIKNIAVLLKFKNISSYIDNKLKNLIKKVNLLTPVLLGKKFGLVGESQRILGLLDLYLDIGMIPKFIIFQDNFEGIKEECINILKYYNFQDKVDIFIDIPREKNINIINNEKYELDLLVGSSVELSNLKLNIKFLEFSFPMITRHFINNYTYLGFNGVLNILTDTYNLLNELEYYNLSNSLATLMGDFTFYHTKNESK